MCGNPWKSLKIYIKDANISSWHVMANDHVSSTPPKFEIPPEKLPKPNRKASSEKPLFFRGELLNFGGVVFETAAGICPISSLCSWLPQIFILSINSSKTTEHMDLQRKLQAGKCEDKRGNNIYHNIFSSHHIPLYHIISYYSNQYHILL